MKPRTGSTLIEVLVAIFVMGIGLMAILTLFPLGAMNMAQAIRDDRVAHSAANAQAVAICRDLRHDPAVMAAFDNPGGGLPNLANIPDYEGPSYPVFLDPFGYYSSVTPASQQWVGDLGPLATGAVPRRNATFVGNAGPLLALGSFSFLDEIDFGAHLNPPPPNNPNPTQPVADGRPNLDSGAIEREPAFSWAYLMRRPRRAVPSVVDMWIVVYSQRPLNLGAALNPHENTYDQTTFDTNRNVITLQWGGNQKQAPELRAGDWILDASFIQGRPHGYFYRITDVNDLGNNTIELSIDGSLQGFPPAAVTPGVAITLEGVTEVIYKGAGWLP